MNGELARIPVSDRSSSNDTVQRYLSCAWKRQRKLCSVRLHRWLLTSEKRDCGV